MKQRRYILAVLLIAMLTALLSRRDAERPMPNEGNHPGRTSPRPPDSGLATASRLQNPAATNPQTSAASRAAKLLQPGPLVGPRPAGDLVAATNAAATALAAGRLPAGFIPPPHTPLIPPPAEGGRTDAPIVPSGFDRPPAEP